MFHIFRKLVSNCVFFALFGAGQTVYSGSIRACLLKVACCCWNRVKTELQIKWAIKNSESEEGKYRSLIILLIGARVKIGKQSNQN